MDNLIKEQYTKLKTKKKELLKVIHDRLENKETKKLLNYSVIGQQIWKCDEILRLREIDKQIKALRSLHYITTENNN